MRYCNINPPGFTTIVSPIAESDQCDAPIVLGYRFVTELARTPISTILDDKVYNVSTTCPDTTYRTPSRLGATIVVNSIILMHPQVVQYLVEPPN